MACLHTHISSPVTVELCLNEEEIECCPNEHETMVVCGDCGMFKIISVEEVCDECCNNDVHIWDNYLNVWQDPTNFFSGIVNYSPYQTALAQAQGANAIINIPRVMLKGYHYTEPTNPIRTDSCKLYLDTSIDGEGSGIEDEVWEVPSTAILDISNRTEEIRENLIPDSNNLIWTLTLNQYIDSSDMAYITLPGASASVGGRFLSHDWEYTPSGTTTVVENIVYTLATRELVMTLSNWSDDYIPPTIRYIVGDSFRIHLKGIHGFYAQT